MSVVPTMANALLNAPDLGPARSLQPASHPHRRRAAASPELVDRMEKSVPLRMCGLAMASPRRPR